MNCFKELTFTNPREEIENIMADPNLYNTIKTLEQKEKDIKILKEKIIP